MIVGTKRDMVMHPQSLADVEKCGFEYIGTLCAKVDEDFEFLPDVDIGGFRATKLGNAYGINFGHTHDEPYWARGEDNIENIDIFVKNYCKKKYDRISNHKQRKEGK